MTEPWLQGQLTGLNWFWHGGWGGWRGALAERVVSSFFAFSQKGTVDVSSAGTAREGERDGVRAGRREQEQIEKGMKSNKKDRAQGRAEERLKRLKRAQAMTLSHQMPGLQPSSSVNGQPP